MTTETTTPPGDLAALPMMLDTTEVAELLRLHIKTVERMIRARRIPAVRVGYRWLVRREDVAEIMQNGLAS